MHVLLAIQSGPLSVSSRVLSLEVAMKANTKDQVQHRWNNACRYKCAQWNKKQKIQSVRHTKEKNAMKFTD